MTLLLTVKDNICIHVYVPVVVITMGYWYFLFQYLSSDLWQEWHDGSHILSRNCLPFRSFFYWVRVPCGLTFSMYIIHCSSFLFDLALVLCVLRFPDPDYPCGILIHFSTILQQYIIYMYHNGQFFWWKKPVFPEKTTDLTTFSLKVVCCTL